MNEEEEENEGPESQSDLIIPMNSAVTQETSWDKTQGQPTEDSAAPIPSTRPLNMSSDHVP